MISGLLARADRRSRQSRPCFAGVGSGRFASHPLPLCCFFTLALMSSCSHCWKESVFLSSSPLDNMHSIDRYYNLHPAEVRFC